VNHLQQKKLVLSFYDKLSKHSNDRFRSFEHCYLFFKKLNRDGSFAQHKERAMLHLGFYLASWGMYRGSSFLLQYDYNIYSPIVDILFKKKYSLLWDLGARQARTLAG
jgi:type IV secretory pathway VirB6-like protein